MTWLPIVCSCLSHAVDLCELVCLEGEGAGHANKSCMRPDRLSPTHFAIGILKLHRRSSVIRSLAAQSPSLEACHCTSFFRVIAFPPNTPRVPLPIPTGMYACQFHPPHNMLMSSVYAA